jgi:hypothetical protein
MGGVDAALGKGAFIPTPLAPNLWRTDFQTGKNRYVFWQFTPLSIALNFADGSVATLCAEADVTSKNACTVIADTGYGSNVVTSDTARAAVQAATDLAGTTCATTLAVQLPTEKGGKAPKTLTIPLTTGGNCSTAVINSTQWVPPPKKLQPNLPANWFVFGQPMLRQLYTGFSFRAYGKGGLFFAPRAA